MSKAASGLEVEPATIAKPSPSTSKKISMLGTPRSVRKVNECSSSPATVSLETSLAEPIEAAIRRAAADHSLWVLGATEAGVLSRLVTDSLRYDVVDEVACSVVIAERSSTRTLRERLFGP